MLVANTNSAEATDSNEGGISKAPVMCCPSVYTLGKVGRRQRNASTRRRHQGDGMDWCGVRSLVASVSARLTAGISNRQGIRTISQNDVWVQKKLQHRERESEVENENTSLQFESLKHAAGEEHTHEQITCIDEWKGEEQSEETAKAVEDDGYSSWWWWDTAGYDLTNVTPADMSTWNELNSWLTATVSDDDSLWTCHEIKQNVHSISSSSSITSLSSTRDEETKGKLKLNDESVIHASWYHSALKMALLRAACHGHRDVVRDVLQQTSRARTVATVDSELHDLINCADSQTGDTALHLASASGYSSIVADLISSGANFNNINKDKESALMLAVRYGRKRCVRALLQAGCDVHVSDSNDDTVLHTAVRYNHVGILRCLLQHNVQCDTMNQEGCTALHVAAQLNRIRCLRLFLQHCRQTRQLHIRNLFGQTAVDIAISHHNYAAATILDKKSTELHRRKLVAARLKGRISGTRRCVVIGNNHADVTVTSGNDFPSPRRQSLRHAGKQQHAVCVQRTSTSRHPR